MTKPVYVLTFGLICLSIGLFLVVLGHDVFTGTFSWAGEWQIVLLTFVCGPFLLWRLHHEMRPER